MRNFPTPSRAQASATAPDNSLASPPHVPAMQSGSHPSKQGKYNNYSSNLLRILYFVLSLFLLVAWLTKVNLNIPIMQVSSA